jgi:hypothetical protein
MKNNIDTFPGVDTSLLDSSGVRGRFNSWSCTVSQRDSTDQVLKISGNSRSVKFSPDRIYLTSIQTPEEESTHWT